METNFMELHDLFKKVEYLYRERVKGILGPLKLSNLEFRYLKNIEEDERPTISEISQRLSKHNSNITGLLDSLEKKGYIRRTMDTVDRRIIRIEYTQEGLSKREEALKIFENKVSLFAFSGFGTVLSSFTLFCGEIGRRENKYGRKEGCVIGNTNVWPPRPKDEKEQVGSGF
jgi:DNA-binding MarR family transcriptional regulator